MALSIRLGLMLRRRRGRGGGEREYDHLLTAAENIVCTAAGTRIVLMRGKHYLQTAGQSGLLTAAESKIRLLSTK